MAASLHIAGIRKVFGKGAKAVEVLKRIDIDVLPGEFLILVGPSGCGKSTLLNIIAGLEEPTEGELLIAGRNVIGIAPAQRDIAMVFQSYALYPTMNVADNIGFALEMRKVPKEVRTKRIAEVAAMLQIEHSAGPAAVAAFRWSAPACSDGPCIGVTPNCSCLTNRYPIWTPNSVWRCALKSSGCTMSAVSPVYVTHDQIEAMTLAAALAVMKDGILQQIGTPDEVYTRPSNTYVASFIGSPTMNMIKGRVEAAGENGRFVFEGGSLTLPCPAVGEAILACVRSICMWRQSLRGAASCIWLSLPVTPMSWCEHLQVILTSRTKPHAPLKEGDPIGLEISGKHTNPVSLHYWVAPGGLSPGNCL